MEHRYNKIWYCKIPVMTKCFHKSKQYLHKVPINYYIKFIYLYFFFHNIYKLTVIALITEKLYCWIYNCIYNKPGETSILTCYTHKSCCYLTINNMVRNHEKCNKLHITILKSCWIIINMIEHRNTTATYRPMECNAHFFFRLRNITIAQ